MEDNHVICRSNVCFAGSLIRSIFLFDARIPAFVHDHVCIADGRHSINDIITNTVSRVEDAWELFGEQRFFLRLLLLNKLINHCGFSSTHFLLIRR